MLIIIPEDSTSYIEKLCASEPIEKLRSLTKILQAHADGQHIVVIPPTICRIIENCPRLSEEQRNVARKVRSKFSELSQLKNLLPIYGKTCTEGQAPILLNDHWNIPFRWIAENGLSKTHLICEDLNDCDISHEAARDFINNNQLNRLQLSLDHTAGGGGNTHRVLAEEAVNASKISLCIVDSDRSTPDDKAPFGETAKKCLEVSGSGLYELIITHGRELENHLPIRLVDKLRMVWHGEKPSINAASFEANHEGVWLFTDLKSGLRRREINKMNAQDKMYWEACAENLPHSRGIGCPVECSSNKEVTCKLVVIEPLGRSLLKDAINYLKDPPRFSSPKRSHEYLPSPNDIFWKKMGAKVAAYGVGIRVNSTM